MRQVSAVSVLFVAPDHPLEPYLHQHPAIACQQADSLPADLSQYAVVILARPGSLSEAEAGQLGQFVQNGGGCLALSQGGGENLPAWFGVQPRPAETISELRILFKDARHPLAIRLPDAFYAPARHHPVELTADSTQTILYADWRYTHVPVLTLNRVGQGYAAYSTLPAFDRPVVKRLYYRLLRYMTGDFEAERTLGVGLLGYSPAVGQLHGQGTAETAGLDFVSACDLNPHRLIEAEAAFPHLKTYGDAADFAADPDLDVVIVTTPPNTHANLSIQMLEAGKHVVCEKPLALNRAEVAAMIEAADKHERLICCHQNRRWDVDYLAVKQAVQERLIGEVFYMETFVGSYSHPCAYWHSHDTISGGTTYDWGAHYLDWIMSLIPDKVTGVISTRQNRLWHDVTNADHERIMLRFANGQEAEFTHSDIAAVPKPKWYLLGTEGSLVGAWQEVTSYSLDPVLYYHRHDLPATEMPPRLTARRRHQASGQLYEQEVPMPLREPYAFHRNLADHVLLGEPLTVPVAQTARVVAVLEAAARSAKQGGTLEELNV